MGLRLLGLWPVVLSLFAVVNGVKNQNCSTPVIQNGFFISENDTLAHDTDLYYGCDEGFKPVDGTWWATVTCQNGNWSSVPECIAETACFDPEIPNANYPAFQYKNDGERVQIRCNTGFEDKRRRLTAICRNGEWAVLPVCEKMDSWCGPPPQVPNTIIVKQTYEDMFPENKVVEYVCKSGFELETNNNYTTCSYGQWLTPPTCRPKQTGQDEGLVPVVATASPGSSDSGNNIQPLFTTIDRCGTPPPISEGEYNIKADNMRVGYTCSYWYKLKGNRIVRCQNGEWTELPTCEVDFCTLDTSRYSDLVNTHHSVYIKSGTTVTLNCFNDSWRTARAVCKNNQLYLSQCCLKVTHNVNNCYYFLQEQ